jgi:nitroreductase
MDAIETMKARRSVRAYEPKPVAREALSKVLEAGRMAPSASNNQPWHFVIVQDPEKRKVLSEGRYAHFLTQSPVVIVGCGDTERAPRWHMVDVTIALQQMVLAATNEGLGTCWIGSFDEDSVRKCLNVPGNWKVVAMLALGYAKDKLDLGAAIMRSKNRKPLEEITSMDEFGKR